jgi:phospholipase/carboxylesterase
MSKASRGRTKLFEYIVQENQSNAAYDMLLFHGFGADSSDLHGLYPYLKDLPVKRFIFPNGVMPANGVPYGRAWFPIDIAALEQAMMTGSYRDLTGDVPETVHKLSTEIEEALINELHIDPAKTIIGGFSQGAMLSMNLCMRSQHQYKAAVHLSGTFLDKNNWKSIMQNRPKFPVYISHGETDALLNPKDAAHFAQALKESGFKVEFQQFAGGHEIPLPVIEGMKQFIKTL